jgi:acetylornithine/succinyldiaminopimelate/putrescine aminotransferase
MTHRQLFLHHLAQTSDLPLLLEIERAEGIYLFDTSGNRYLDLIAGIGVSSLGHRHPAVEAAVTRQLQRYWHTMVYGEYVLAPQVQLAGLLTENLPPRLDCVYFVNSGSEATEGAMKLAKKYTGRAEIVACHNAYHGSTQGSASLMSPATFTQPYHPLLPGIRHISFNDLGSLCEITRHTAAVIVEPVQAEAGVILPEKAFFTALRQRCDETGALLIFDEIQTGFGRTGSLFAFGQLGVVPDVLLLAKGMGGGMPIGAFVASRELMATLASAPPLGHITTFGGHPVCCAAAHATLRTLLDSGLIGQVKAKEQVFQKELAHPAIVEVRSAGLMLAVELASFDTVMRVVRGCLARGIVVDWFLFNQHSLRIAPPLIISISEIRSACHSILEVLEEVGAAG